jgi:hypothetical protein
LLTPKQKENIETALNGLPANNQYVARLKKLLQSNDENQIQAQWLAPLKRAQDSNQFPKDPVLLGLYEAVRQALEPSLHDRFEAIRHQITELEKTLPSQSDPSSLEIYARQETARSLIQSFYAAFATMPESEEVLKEKIKAWIPALPYRFSKTGFTGDPQSPANLICLALAKLVKGKDESIWAILTPECTEFIGGIPAYGEALLSNQTLINYRYIYRQAQTPEGLEELKKRFGEDTNLLERITHFFHGHRDFWADAENQLLKEDKEVQAILKDCNNYYDFFEKVRQFLNTHREGTTGQKDPSDAVLDVFKPYQHIMQAFQFWARNASQKDVILPASSVGKDNLLEVIDNLFTYKTASCFDNNYAILTRLLTEGSTCAHFLKDQPIQFSQINQAEYERTMHAPLVGSDELDYFVEHARLINPLNKQDLLAGINATDRVLMQKWAEHYRWVAGPKALSAKYLFDFCYMIKDDKQKLDFLKAILGDPVNLDRLEPEVDSQDEQTALFQTYAIKAKLTDLACIPGGKGKLRNDYLEWIKTLQSVSLKTLVLHYYPLIDNSRVDFQQLVDLMISIKNDSDTLFDLDEYLSLCNLLTSEELLILGEYLEDSLEIQNEIQIALQWGSGEFLAGLTELPLLKVPAAMKALGSAFKRRMLDEVLLQNSSSTTLMNLSPEMKYCLVELLKDELNALKLSPSPQTFSILAYFKEIGLPLYMSIFGDKLLTLMGDPKANPEGFLGVYIRITDSLSEADFPGFPHALYEQVKDQLGGFFSPLTAKSFKIFACLTPEDAKTLFVEQKANIEKYFKTNPIGKAVIIFDDKVSSPRNNWENLKPMILNSITKKQDVLDMVRSLNGDVRDEFMRACFEQKSEHLPDCYDLNLLHKFATAFFPDQMKWVICVLNNLKPNKDAHFIHDHMLGALLEKLKADNFPPEVKAEWVKAVNKLIYHYVNHELTSLENLLKVRKLFSGLVPHEMAEVNRCFAEKNRMAERVFKVLYKKDPAAVSTDEAIFDRLKAPEMKEAWRIASLPSEDQRQNALIENLHSVVTASPYMPHWSAVSKPPVHKPTQVAVPDDIKAACKFK